MGERAVPTFSLTPDEERFFVRFLRRRALPWSAGLGVLCGGLTAAVLTCNWAPEPTASRAEAPAAPLVDERARADLAALRKELEALRAQPAPAPASAAAAPAPDDARLAELRRSIDGLKRELQTIATSVTELERRTPAESAPAAPAQYSDDR